MRKSNALKNLKDLQLNGKELALFQPSLEAEPLHRRLHRLDGELRKATEALQQFNKEWAERNVKAQACRLAISTPEITFAANKRRELAARIREIQTEIGIANKERRSLNAKTSQKASGGGLEGELLPFPKKQVRSKNCPLKQHREGTVYFELAARDELAPDLYAGLSGQPRRFWNMQFRPGLKSHDVARANSQVPGKLPAGRIRLSWTFANILGRVRSGKWIRSG